MKVEAGKKGLEGSAAGKDGGKQITNERKRIGVESRPNRRRDGSKVQHGATYK